MCNKNKSMNEYNINTNTKNPENKGNELDDGKNKKKDGI